MLELLGKKTHIHNFPFEEVKHDKEKTCSDKITSESE